ncbi:MAG: HU family DNA-binding protein [Planctomycetes bacterium]|nr:HU family DNA-binding protein [Planctomycetota bacterium]
MNIPFLPDAGSADPLRRIVQDVGARTGLSPQHVATIISHGLEAIADEVSKGRAVTLPGFGAIFPVTRTVRARGTDTKVTSTVIRFSAARGFREQVRYGAPPSETGRRRYVRHMRNHALGGPEHRCSERAFTAGRAFRDAIASQLGGEVSFD